MCTWAPYTTGEIHVCKLPPSTPSADPAHMFTEDPESQSPLVGSPVTLKCVYNEEVRERSKGWTWEFYQYGERQMTIRGNDTQP